MEQSPISWNPGLYEVASFPALVRAINPISARMAQVILADGTESRLVLNDKRGLIVPRRWRKPRTAAAMELASYGKAVTDYPTFVGVDPASGPDQSVEWFIGDS